jgi:hypothetical protein
LRFSGVAKSSRPAVRCPRACASLRVVKLLDLGRELGVDGLLISMPKARPG